MNKTLRYQPDQERPTISTRNTVPISTVEETTAVSGFVMCTSKHCGFKLSRKICEEDLSYECVILMNWL